MLVGWRFGGVIPGNASGIGFHIEGGRNFQFIGHCCGKTEQPKGVFVVDVKGTFPSEPKENVYASTSTNISSPVFLLSRFAQTTYAALTYVRAPPNFDPLQLFQLHLEEEY